MARLRTLERRARALAAAHYFCEGVEKLDAGVDLVAVDRDALDIYAERNVACVGLLEDAAEILAADVDGFRERVRRAEDGALGLRRDIDAQPAQKAERLLAAAGREGEHDATRLDAGAAAIAQIVAQQALRRRRVIHGLRDEIAAAFDRLGEQTRRLAALVVVPLGDQHATD